MIKWGFAIEKETSFVGYDKNLKRITHKTQGRIGPYAHEQSRLLKLGKYALGGGDSTVFSGQPGYGAEIVTNVNVIKEKPKKILTGFIHDVNKYSKTMIPDREVAEPIPFGSVPRMKSSDFFQKVPGSYHVNMTMPYDDNSLDKSAYKKKLLEGLKNMRAIQPLMMALTGGTSVDSVGKPEHLEGSLRQNYSRGTSGVGYGNLNNGKIVDAISTVSWTSHTPSPQGAQKWRHELSDEFEGIGTAAFSDIVIKNYTNGVVPTIEMRWMDAFDTRGMYDVVRVLASTLANGKNTHISGDPQNALSWNDAMKEVMKEGWNSYIPKSYVNYLNRELGLSLTVPKKNIRADILFSQVSEQLWKKNHDDDWVKTWMDESKPPKVHNFNKDSWEYYLLQEVKKKDFGDKIKKLLSILGRIDASSSDGWVRVNWKKGAKGYGFRDIILDERVVGIDIGAEDTEDLLHYLARYQFIELRVNDSGVVTHIHPLYTSDEGMRSLWKKMLSTSTLLNEDGEGLIDIGEAPTEEVITPEPSTPEQRTSGATIALRESRDPFRNVNIPGIVFTPIASVEEDDLYNRDDLQEIMNYANLYWVPSEVLRVRVFYRKISFSSSPVVKQYFILDNSNLSIYIDPDAYRDRINLSEWILRWKEVPMTGYDYQTGTEGIRMFAKGYRDPEISNLVSFSDSQEMYNYLITIIRNQFSKASTSPPAMNKTIELTRAGIQTLAQMGVYLVSIERGKQYRLANDERLQGSKKKDVRVLKTIPYYKDYRVVLREGTLRLLKKGRVVDTIKTGGKDIGN